MVFGWDPTAAGYMGGSEDYCWTADNPPAMNEALALQQYFGVPVSNVQR
jgi:hypothetical protein